MLLSLVRPSSLSGVKGSFSRARVARRGSANRASAGWRDRHSPQLAGEDVIDLGGERPAASAEKAITPEHAQPQRSPRSRRSSAGRVLGTGLSVRASWHRADGERSSRHRPTVDARRRGPSVSDASGERPDEQQQTCDRRERKDCRRATTARQRRPNQPNNAYGCGSQSNDDHDPCSGLAAVLPHRRAISVVLVLHGQTENRPHQASEDESRERDQTSTVFEQTRWASEADDHYAKEDHYAQEANERLPCPQGPGKRKRSAERGHEEWGASVKRLGELDRGRLL